MGDAWHPYFCKKIAPANAEATTHLFQKGVTEKTKRTNIQYNHSNNFIISITI